VNFIKRILYVLFSIFFNALSRFTRKNDRFLFVSFSGGYYDNLKYFDKYVRENKPDTRIVWLSSGDMSLYEGEYHNLFSLSGIKYLLTSNIILLNGWSTMFSYLKFPRNVCVVQLWHGLPVRCIGNDDKWINKSTLKDMLRCSIQWSLFTSTTKSSIGYLSKAFSISPDIISNTGFARCDMFLSISAQEILVLRKNLELKTFNNIMLYAPTWRPYVDNYEIDFSLLNNALKKNNDVLIVKMHPNSRNIPEANLSNVVFDLNNTDVQDLLVISDCLITDYSSIAADFSLMKRPILYFCYDYEKYEQNVGLYIDMKEAFKDSLITTLEKLTFYIKSQKWEEQNKCVGIFHDQIDCNSSERIFEQISKQIGTLN